MGNCIKRKRRVVLEFDNVKNDSQAYIRGHKENDLSSSDINNNAKSSIARSQDQGKPSGHVHRKSHPLPTPIESQQISQNIENNNKGGFYPLPKPEPPPKPVLQESSLRSMPRSETEILSSPYLKSFSLKELRKATSNFSEASKLGEGGFGCVYKGWLDVETLTAARPAFGIPVAIKMLIKDGIQGHKEWLSEVNYLGQLRHSNLVKLIGYCLDGEERILVYEFMPGGSLERHLFSRRSPSLSWVRRIKVAIGAARGLCFLHQSNSPVIYRDFKTSNILLDSDFNAKLSDFGLARAGPTSESQSHITTRVMGTEGYCCPNYIQSGKLTVKCDVYSFGVVLLELITGRRVKDETKCQEERSLVDWVKFHVNDQENKITRIMDTKLEGQYCKKSAIIAAGIALRCTNPVPKYRPPMTYILEILEDLPSNKHH